MIFFVHSARRVQHDSLVGVVSVVVVETFFGVMIDGVFCISKCRYL